MVPHILTMQEVELLKPKGRLAHCLLDDLYWGRLASYQFDGDASLITLFRPCKELRNPHFQTWPSSRHDLVLVESQSFESVEAFQGPSPTQISSYCLRCHYHFVFIATAGHCGKDDRFGQDHPLHHYKLVSAENVQAGSHVDPTDDVRKLYPLVSQARLHCTVCLQKVDMQMTAPRMKAQWMLALADRTRIRDQIREARKLSPDRFSKEDEDKWATMAFDTLNAYLRDLLRDPEPRKISLQNRRFLAQFGRALDDLFIYLGFTLERDASNEESKWVMPRLPAASGKTALGSFRAFLEDVQSEVQTGLTEDRSEVKATPAHVRLERALGCENRKGRILQHANYGQNPRVLGTTADSMMGTFKYAYERQVATDAPNRKVYLQAFKEIVLQADWIDGQVFAAEEESRDQAEEMDQARLDDAQDLGAPYRYFGLQPDTAVDAGDDLILGIYHHYRAQAPLQKHLHRKALLNIAKQRKSQDIMTEVTQPMALDEAYATLRGQPEWPCDVLAACVLTDDTQQRENVVNALETITRARAHDTHVGALCAKLAEAKVERPLIVGLANLRNTCYLNSILQYFYSVKAVRDLVLEANPPVLQPSQESLCTMLAGGNRVADLDPGRAYVGTEFALELKQLFQELQSTTVPAITPRQRLANAALLRPERSRAQEQVNVAPVPPLPPRDNHETKVTVDAVSAETGSDKSSQTLVNQADDESTYVVVDRSEEPTREKTAADTDMADLGDVASAHADSAVDVDAAKTPDTKLSVEELAAELDKPNIGSDQMDVDEVMGNVIDHLRAAFKVINLGGDASQPDPIQEAFFSTFVDYRARTDGKEWKHSTRSDRWVTAYPAPRQTTQAISLYEALEASFDRDLLTDTNLMTFTSIQHVAPHFHVYIQRSDGGGKNTNSIVIPETIYLDRYMDSAMESGASIFGKRKRSWDLKARLTQLEANKASGAGDSMRWVNSYEPIVARDSALWKVGSDVARAIAEKYPNYKSPIVQPTTAQAGDLGLRLPKPSTGDTKTASVSLAERRQQAAAEYDRLKAERDSLFDGLESVKYRLHAVICHLGSTARAGHYWVWIHDFASDKWRKYNDTTVTEHGGAEVMEKLKGSEPYYLAYVRDQNLQDLVSIPARAMSERINDKTTATTATTTTATTTTTVMQPEDAQMQEDDPAGILGHAGVGPRGDTEMVDLTGTNAQAVGEHVVEDVPMATHHEYVTDAVMLE